MKVPAYLLPIFSTVRADQTYLRQNNYQDFLDEI